MKAQAPGLSVGTRIERSRSPPRLTPTLRRLRPGRKSMRRRCAYGYIAHCVQRSVCCYTEQPPPPPPHRLIGAGGAQSGAAARGVLVVDAVLLGRCLGGSERGGSLRRLAAVGPRRAEAIGAVQRCGGTLRFACTAPLVVRGPSALVHARCIDRWYVLGRWVACVHPHVPQRRR
jgi:hypothetical protein